MGPVQCLVIALLSSARLALANPPMERTYSVHGAECKLCPAGTHQRSCTQCHPCPAGTFTTDWNDDNTCQHCFGDCRPDYHLKVIWNCNRTSDLKCVCEDGFKCTKLVPYTENCGSCEAQESTNPTAVATSRNDMRKPSWASSEGRSSSPAEPCQFPNCGPQPVAPTPSAVVKSSLLAAILCPVLFLGCLALVILLCVRRLREETCFWQTFAKLCSGGKQASASYKSKEAGHHLPKDSFRAKQQQQQQQQQTPSPSATNLGPVHVHNPGTVIFSLLSQFTGQVGPTTVGGKTAAASASEGEDGARAPRARRPPTSPGVQLSEEEERGAEMDCIFFPSQEQGKDCHVSKEEEL